MDDGGENLVETGVVVRRLPPEPGRLARVTVQVEPGDCCEGCGARALCHAAADDRREVEADDTFGCEAGDRVRIEVPGAQVLRMSFLVYGLPLLLLLAGVGFGAMLIPAGAWRDGGSFLLAVGLTSAGFPLARVLARRHGDTGAHLRARVIERTRAAQIPAQ